MPDLATLGAFVAVVLGLFVIPGPAVLLVFSRAAQGGRGVGVATGLGIAVGDFLHTLFAAVGLSALLMTSALAFNLVKYLGAAYLIYLGVRAMLARPAADAALAQLPAISPAKAFWQAIPTELLNPKTALFFLAFMPQFVHPQQGSALVQFMVLGLVFVALSAAYTTALACSVPLLGRYVRRLSWLARWQGKIVGSIFIALGLRVAVQSR